LPFLGVLFCEPLSIAASLARSSGDKPSKAAARALRATVEVISLETAPDFAALGIAGIRNMLSAKGVAETSSTPVGDIKSPQSQTYLSS
jgi:hypothetical protein